MLKVCLKETIVLKMLMSMGDVVLYNEQLWQADTNIEAQDVPNMFQLKQRPKRQKMIMMSGPKDIPMSSPI